MGEGFNEAALKKRGGLDLAELTSERKKVLKSTVIRRLTVSIG